MDNLPTAEDEGDDSDNSLFVGDGPRSSKRPRATTNLESPQSIDSEPLTKRRKEGQDAEVDEGEDEKKKMAMDTTYEGFAIYGRVLCLVVKRKDKKYREYRTKWVILKGFF